MSEYSDKIARILRIDKHVLGELELDLAKKTNKYDVMQKICEENEYLIKQRLDKFGLSEKSHARKIYDALIEKIKEDDEKLFNYIGLKDDKGHEAAKKVCTFVTKAMPPKMGFFLKKEKAIEFLIHTPPKKIMDNLGYKDVKEMIANEDPMEIYSALRFLAFTLLATTTCWRSLAMAATLSSWRNTCARCSRASLGSKIGRASCRERVYVLV